MATVHTCRARLAGLSNHRAPDDPEVVDARRDLRAEVLTAYVKKVVAQAPPLTDEQIERIAVLLRGGAIA